MKTSGINKKILVVLNESKDKNSDAIHSDNFPHLAYNIEKVLLPKLKKKAVWLHPVLVKPDPNKLYIIKWNVKCENFNPALNKEIEIGIAIYDDGMNIYGIEGYMEIPE